MNPLAGQLLCRCNLRLDFTFMDNLDKLDLNVKTWDLSHVSSCLLGVRLETGSEAARSKDGGASEQLTSGGGGEEGSCYWLSLTRTTSEKNGNARSTHISDKTETTATAISFQRLFQLSSSCRRTVLQKITSLYCQAVFSWVLYHHTSMPAWVTQ